MSDEKIAIRRATIPIPDFVTNSIAQHEQQIADVKYPTHTIPLPTKGYFYPEGHPLSCGTIEIKEMTAREEDILANQELIKKGKVLDTLISSLLVNKSIRIEDVLVADKNAIFIAIRRFAYGDEYKVAMVCPKCGGENKVTLNLGELREKDVNFEIETVAFKVIAKLLLGISACDIISNL
jgi:hypothetical protein